MTASYSHLSVLQNSVVTETFVDTADQNYLIARWAYHRGMFTDFFWNSVHALEKYFKASLLLNGQSGISDADRNEFRHDLIKLYKAVSSYAGDLLPNALEQPQQLRGIDWQNENLLDFLARFNELGDANNRYNLYGYRQRWEDLCHLDQAVFSIRRLAFNLDSSPFIGQPNPSGTEPKTVQEMLKRDPKYTPRSNGSRLYKLLGVKGDDELREAGLKMNFVLAPDDFDHGLDSVKIGSSSSNPALYRHIVVRAKSMSPSAADAEAADLADWVVEKMYLPGREKEDLKKYAAILRARCSKESIPDDTTL